MADANATKTNVDTLKCCLVRNRAYHPALLCHCAAPFVISHFAVYPYYYYNNSFTGNISKG
jgi:hypothetical protein